MPLKTNDKLGKNHPGTMQYSFQTYQHPFQRPLQTRYGLWSVRQGLIVTLIDDSGTLGQGEIAPLSWFGSESWEQAQDYCRHLPPQLTETDILSIPEDYPACQFGWGSAWAALTSPSTERLQPPLPMCGLLPRGKMALSEYAHLWQQGYQTLKWKIGVEPLATEQAIFLDLIAALPPGTTLRLDANGGLTYESACQWLELCDRQTNKVNIEYLEQPLPPHQFAEMLALRQQFQTPLALDESVATLVQLQRCYQQGWRGIFIIKPAICGYPDQLRHFCQIHTIDAVFSSVFESKVGRRACLQLAQELSNPDRAIGFGVNHWLPTA